MKNIYTRLDPSSTIEDIRRLVADIGEMAVDMGSTQVNRSEPEKPVEKTEKEIDGVEQEDAPPEFQRKIDDLLLSVDQLADYITMFQSQQDRNLDAIKDTISNGVKNYKTAYDATTFYTKGWFSRLFLSLDAKIELARFLIETIQPYCKSNLETFKLIHNRDPLIILYITYPRDDR